MTSWTIVIIAFVFGAVVGSFLNVCIYRIPLGLSVVSPGSRCPECRRPVPFYYNVPIISYALLGGRCAFCKTPLSFQYPLVEALTGAFYALLVWRFGLAIDTAVYAAFISCLVVITFIDLKLQIIPDVISLPGIPVGLVLSFFTASPGVINAVIGAFSGGAILLCIAAGYHKLTGVEGMGGGDIKLLAMIGAFIGWKGVLVTILAGSFLGAIVGVITMLVFGRGSRHAIPFGPFLSAGAVIYIFFGSSAIRWYIMRTIGA